MDCSWRAIVMRYSRVNRATVERICRWMIHGFDSASRFHSRRRRPLGRSRGIFVRSSRPFYSGSLNPSERAGRHCSRGWRALICGGRRGSGFKRNVVQGSETSLKLECRIYRGYNIFLGDVAGVRLNKYEMIGFKLWWGQFSVYLLRFVRIGVNPLHFVFHVSRISFCFISSIFLRITRGPPVLLINYDVSTWNEFVPVFKFAQVNANQSIFLDLGAVGMITIVDQLLLPHLLSEVSVPCD